MSQSPAHKRVDFGLLHNFSRKPLGGQRVKGEMGNMPVVFEYSYYCTLNIW